MVFGLIPRRLAVGALWAFCLVAMGVAGWLAVRVMVTISLVLVSCVAALLLTALLNPFTQWLRRRHLPRGLAAAVTFLALIVVFLAVGGLTGFMTANRFNDLISEFSDSLSQLHDTLVHGPLPIDQSTLDNVQKRAQQALQGFSQGLASTVLSATETTARFITGILLSAFVLIFFLYDGRRIWQWLMDRLPDRASQRVDAAGEAAWVTLSGFVHGTFLIAVIHGVVIGSTLFFLGVPIFFPLALLVFLGSFIPVVGAFVAGGIAVIVTLGTQGLVPAVILLAVLLFENELESHVLQPFVVGRYVRLHPLVIVLVLTIGALLGGVFGTLIAVPLTGVAYNAWAPLNGRASSVVENEKGKTSRLQRLWNGLGRLANKAKKHRR